ncbi:hypothetical protein A2U01_0094574, partial [Trifolium medium]|nr:hypothetical protein [Trifolium medium]
YGENVISGVVEEVDKRVRLHGNSFGFSQWQPHR